MASDFSQLSRGNVCHKVVGWMSTAVEEGGYILYIRDDYNRDLLVEVDDKAKTLALLQAVVEDQHRHPIVIGECQIWYYDVGRQLCAKVTPNSGFGLVRCEPRQWKWGAYGIGNIHEVADDCVRIDFFVFIVPDPSMWIQARATNGNTYSQIVFNLSTTCKLTLQLWHRTKLGDIPRLEHPLAPDGTTVCLTNANVKVFRNSILLSSSSWSVLLPVENCVAHRNVTLGQCVVPPEIFDVDQLRGEFLEQEKPNLNEDDMLWVSQTTTSTKSTKEKVKKDTKVRTDSDAFIFKKSSPGKIVRHQKTKDEVGVKKNTTLKENEATLFGAPVKLEKSHRVDIDESEFVALPETGEPEKDHFMEEKVGSKSTQPTKEGRITVRKQPFPAGKKGSDMIGTRVEVRGRGSGIIAGGGAARIRIIFDEDAQTKWESHVPVNKVFLQ